MPTIKDVAKAAGVSIATVSYVLNGTKSVSPEVEARVRGAVQTLGYRPQASARNLRKQESRIIGYELPSFTTGDTGTLMHKFIYQLAMAAGREGYHLMTFTPEPERTIVQSYENLISAQRVDGIVLSHTYWDDPRIPLLLDSGIPFAAFGRSNHDLDFAYVDVDGYTGMVQVAEHLLEQGHQRFAFVGWPEGSISGDARFAGFSDTIAAAGYPLDPQMVVRVDNNVEQGYSAGTQLMAYANGPTAIACVSDVIAVGVMRSLSIYGYTVGRDVAVSGFDDIVLTEYVNPPLTSVRQPLEKIGELLIDILLAHLNKDDIPLQEQQILLNPQLVIRESTAPN